MVKHGEEIFAGKCLREKSSKSCHGVQHDFVHLPVSSFMQQFLVLEQYGIVFPSTVKIIGQKIG